MLTSLRSLCVLLLLAAGTLLANATATPGRAVTLSAGDIREVQDELRKRNLFFGDLDGRMTPQLSGALKRYQKRKGFEPTGAFDDPTVASLQIRSASAAAVAATEPQATPAADAIGVSTASTQADAAKRETTIVANATTTISAPETTVAAETVAASEASSTTEAAAELLTERSGRSWADLPVVPEPPAEAPPASTELTSERVTRFVETYLSDGETDDIALQVWFYSFPADYFQHGRVGQDFVVNDTRGYVKRWPQRKYRIVGPVNFAGSGKEGESTIEFTIDYTVGNKDGTKSGRTRNFWTVRANGEDMKIVAIREEHLSQ